MSARKALTFEDSFEQLLADCVAPAKKNIAQTSTKTRLRVDPQTKILIGYEFRDQLAEQEKNDEPAAKKKRLCKKTVRRKRNTEDIKRQEVSDKVSEKENNSNNVVETTNCEFNETQYASIKKKLDIG